MPPDPVSTSTVPEQPSAEQTRREKRLTRSGFLIVMAIGLWAAVGLAGVRTSVASERSDLYRLEVLHASIARPGLAAPLQITVSPLSGDLPESVTLRVDSAYLEIFDENGFAPEPAQTYRDTEWTWWTFEVPAPADQLSVSLDARLEPSVQWRRSGRMELMSGGRPEVGVRVVTWVLP